MFIFSIHKVTHSTSLILDLFLKKIGGQSGREILIILKKFVSKF